MNSESSLNDATARGSRPLCLNNLSAMVLEFLKKNPVTTFSDVADMIVSKISKKYKDISADKTTRRRVYDVLNVFLATGIITKDNKKIRYSPTNQIPAEGEIKSESENERKVKTDEENEISTETEDEREEEEDNPSSIMSDNEESDGSSQANGLSESDLARAKEQIIQKIKLYLRYKLLLLRNQQMPNRPENSVQLPAIFIGVDTELKDIVRFNNNYSLQIRAPNNPQFFSPNDILNTLEFPIEYQKQVFHKEMPEFLEFENDIFQEGTEEEE